MPDDEGVGARGKGVVRVNGWAGKGHRALCGVHSSQMVRWPGCRLKTLCLLSHCISHRSPRDPAGSRHGRPRASQEPAPHGQTHEGRRRARRRCHELARECGLQGCRSRPVLPHRHRGLTLVQIGEAKAVCARCPVRERCLEWALDVAQVEGVWGGTTESENAERRDDARPGGKPSRSVRRRPDQDTTTRSCHTMPCHTFTTLSVLSGEGKATNRCPAAVPDRARVRCADPAARRSCDVLMVVMT